MRKIELEERKTLQLDILDEIHRFCKNNNIRYSVAYGTLLGAIRHGGYIPWDDDIDIVMLRNDYDKFVASFSTDRYKVADVTTLDNWYLPFAKVYDDETVIFDRKANTPPIGVNVDVFPIDDAMDSESEFIKQRKHIKYLTLCNRMKLFKINNDSTWYNNFIGVIAKMVLSIFPKYYFVKELIKESRKYNGKGCNKALYWASLGKAMFMDKGIYEQLCDIQFENHIYCSVKQYDIYLTNIYGDYMTPPPIEKRISYHTSDAYWK